MACRPSAWGAGAVDGTVAWHQSIELYDVARRAQKNVLMAASIGEDHGLRQKKNRMDSQRRILAWSGHCLKGEAETRRQSAKTRAGL